MKRMLNLPSLAVACKEVTQAAAARESNIENTRRFFIRTRALPGKRYLISLMITLPVSDMGRQA
jgi:hypothetical protein